MLKKWIKDFITPPLTSDDENADTVFILHSITLWGIPVLLLIALIRIVSGDNHIDDIHIFLGIVILTFLVGRVALRFGYFRIASRAILVVAWAGVTYLAWSSDGLQNNSLVPYMTIILASAILLGEVDTLVLSAVSIAAIWGIAYADVTGLRITDTPQNSYDLALNLSVNFSLSTVAIYYMIRILRKSFMLGQKELIEGRQMEAALRENEEKFRKVFHSSPVAICITAIEDGRLLEANYAYWELMGLNPDDSLGKTSEELKLWSTSEKREAFVQNLKAKGSYYNPDDSFEDENGILKHAISFYEIIHVGNEERVLSMFYDMSEQRQLINELETKNREFETLRESTAIVAASLEISETVNRILEQVQRVVKYDSASVWLYQKDRAVMIGSKSLPPGAEAPGYYTPNEREPDRPFFANPETPYIVIHDIQENYPQFRGQSKKYIRGWMAVPLRARGKLIGFISLDSRNPGQYGEPDAQLALSYSNQVSIALENARLFSDLQAELSVRQNLIAELESKNAELERFTYTVSHDLKSPLFTIRGFLGYLEEDALAGNHERMKSDMQRIRDATNKMQQLLNELLELSRVGRVKNESVSIPFEELAREAVELVHGRIMERGVAVHIDADMPTVYGDRQRLMEVVQNLVDNAAKFMGDQPEPRIEIGQDGDVEGMPIFHVRDNGIGIPEEHHDRVFGLFNKLDAKGDGTGIGLALVKRIIEVHGGRIWVEGEAGRGSTFYFTLPSQPKPDSVI